MSDHNTSEAGIVLSEAQQRMRRRRSIALGLMIGGLVVLFYLITVLRMGAGVAQRAL